METGKGVLKMKRKRKRPLSLLCRKRYERKRAVVEDRFIALPDDILHHILSLLPLKEAVATSVLCKRWRYIWTFVPNLNFSPSNFMIQYKHKFIQMIYQVLTLHKGSNLCEFRIRYPLDRISSSHIARWIAFAIASGVPFLDLGMSSSACPPLIRPTAYALPSTFFDKDMRSELYLKHLCPNFSILEPQLGVERFFRSLRDLSLRYVLLTDQHVQNILSSCLSLEHLCLEGCDTLINIKHAVPLDKLKCLEIYLCCNLKTLEVFAKNLVSFKYEGLEINIYLKDASHLVDVSFRAINYNLSPLSGYLSQLQILFVDVGYCEAEFGIHNLPTFSCLKHLVLFKNKFYEDGSNLGLTSLIKASPLLHRFELHLSIPRYEKKRRKSRIAFEHPHKYLKEVMISGFEGHSSDVEFAMCLFENTVALEKIELTTRFMSFSEGYWHSRRVIDEHFARKCAEQLRTRLPPGARLEFSC